MNDTNTNQPNNDQIKKIGRMLSRIAEIAVQVSLTGSLEKGVEVSLQQYNASVQLLEQLGAVPAGFFLPLAADTGFDAVGVACAQLASYLGGDSEEGAVAGMGHQIGPKYIIEQHNQAQFTPNELAELRELLSRHMSQ